jgi:hypothetical protein
MESCKRTGLTCDPFPAAALRQRLVLHEHVGADRVRMDLEKYFRSKRRTFIG